MGLSCGGSCMKILLIIFNVIFFIGGGALLGIGIWLLVDPAIQIYLQNVFPDGSDPLFKGSAIVLTVIGALTFILGFLGCCGALRESPCMLSTFAAFLLIILIAEITAAILAAVFRNELGTVLKSEMDVQVKVVTRETTGDIPPTSAAWHFMQVELKCCGSSNYTDYKNVSDFDKTYPVPLTCCTLLADNADTPRPVDEAKCFSEATGKTPPNANFIHTIGCYDAITQWFEDKSAILIGIGIAIGLIQFFGVAFACCLKAEVEEAKTY